MNSWKNACIYHNHMKTQPYFFGELILSRITHYEISEARI